MLQPCCRTSALTHWCICSAGLGAGENVVEVVPHTYLRDFQRVTRFKVFQKNKDNTVGVSAVNINSH